MEESPLLSSSSSPSASSIPTDELFERLQREAKTAIEKEPELSSLLRRTVLDDGVKSFEDAVAVTVCYRLQVSNNSTSVQNEQQQQLTCRKSVQCMFRNALHSKDYSEGGHSMAKLIREDCLAVLQRDPATVTILEVVLFYKGFAALVCHRVARQKWLETLPNCRSFTALYLQSQASSLFGLDIHPASIIGAGIMFDHGTGVVIGETAVVGDGSTLLHGVTLGGTGKQAGDRHPKIGKQVLIGAGTSILGNIAVGDAAKIGAGSVVLRPIPAHATAVGAPAKIIGHAKESDPAGDPDETLKSVKMLGTPKGHAKALHGSIASTASTASLSDMGSDDSWTAVDNDKVDSPTDHMCPFREYQKMAKHAPKGTITICTIGEILKRAGGPCDQAGNIFFALDTKNEGYCSVERFLKHGADAIKQYTDFASDIVDEIVEQFGKKKQHSFSLLSAIGGRKTHVALQSQYLAAAGLAAVGVMTIVRVNKQ